MSEKEVGLGDLVTFTGSYYVEYECDIRHVMTTEFLVGIVVECDNRIIVIMSQESFCIFIRDIHGKDNFKIRKIERL